MDLSLIDNRRGNHRVAAHQQYRAHAFGRRILKNEYERRVQGNVFCGHTVRSYLSGGGTVLEPDVSLSI